MAPETVKSVQEKLQHTAPDPRSTTSKFPKSSFQLASRTWLRENTYYSKVSLVHKIRSILLVLFCAAVFGILRRLLYRIHLPHLDSSFIMLVLSSLLGLYWQLSSRKSISVISLHFLAKAFLVFHSKGLFAFFPVANSNLPTS